MAASSYHRGRFYSMPKWDGSLSSRFGNTPIRMEREDLLENDRRRHAAWNNRPILPPISTSLPLQNMTSDNDVASPRQTPRNDNISDLQFHIKRLCDTYLPPQGTLAAVPIKLSSDEELLLLQQCKMDLKHVNPESLKSVYLEMADVDPPLSGYLAFQDIITILTNNKMYLGARPLCLVASMFISRTEPGLVNYERLLSFLGTAMKMSADDIRRTTSTPKENLSSSGYGTNKMEKTTYYQAETPRNAVSPALDTSLDAMLLRDLSESLKTYGGRQIDFDGLRLAFQRADSLVRGSLSEHQIKSICKERGVPLSDDLMERAVHRCTHRGGGQYDWQQFVHLLERVQPLQTGLYIPQSKRPLDYVKQMPNPSSSWPHADVPSHYPSNTQAEMGRYYEDVVPQQAPSPAPETLREKYYSSNNVQEDLDPYNIRQLPVSDVNKFSNGALPPWAARTTGEEYLTARQASGPFQPPQQAPPFPSEFKQQSATPQPQENSSRPLLPPVITVNDPYSYEVEKESWLNRFMRLANALYKEDKECRGTLPQETVRWVSNQYNSNFLLRLDDGTILEAMNLSKRPNGRIDLSSFLKILSMKG